MTNKTNSKNPVVRTAVIAACFFLVSFGDSVIAPEPIVTERARPQFGTTPPDCGHLYNNGNHEAWAECMGVGYVTDEEE